MGAPIIVAVLGIAGLYLQARVNALRRERERLHSDRKDLYIRILEPYIRAFSQAKHSSTRKRQTDVDIAQLIQSFDYRKVSFELGFVGSDDVLRAVNEFTQYFYSLENRKESNPEASREGLVKFGHLLLEIRKDLGNRKTKLDEYDMLEGFINDIRQLRTS